MNKIFESCGTKNVSIGIQKKHGSSSVGDLYHEYEDINIFKMFDSNQIYVVIIRDVLDRWASGQKEELLDKIEYQFESAKEKRFLYKFQSFKFKSFVDVHNKILEKIYNAYKIVEEWYYINHSVFRWYNKSDISLINLIYEPNVYFLDLKNLSNPKFLKWLQEKDEKWKVVLEIKWNNPTTLFWENMELFFKEIERGTILKETPRLDIINLNANNPKTKKMLCLPRKEPENHMGANIISDFVSEQQKVVDFIRNEHERYIIL